MDAGGWVVLHGQGQVADVLVLECTPVHWGGVERCRRCSRRLVPAPCNYTCLPATTNTSPMIHNVHILDTAQLVFFKHTSVFFQHCWHPRCADSQAGCIGHVPLPSDLACCAILRHCTFLPGCRILV